MGPAEYDYKEEADSIIRDPIKWCLLKYYKKLLSEHFTLFVLS